MKTLLSNKTYVIMGVANQRSIAWGIACALHQAGAKLIFTVATERFEKSVRSLVDTLEGANSPIIQCDVTVDISIGQCFDRIKEQEERIDVVYHFISFAYMEEFCSVYCNVT